MSTSSHPYLHQEYDEADAIRAVHRAFAAGINYFDTAPFYGITRSEKVRAHEGVASVPPAWPAAQPPLPCTCLQVLGQALKGLPRSEIVVSSKVCGQEGRVDAMEEGCQCPLRA